MPFSSGTFTFSSNTFAPSPTTGTTISSTDATSTWSDLATALSTCVLKDGSQTITANIPMAGFKFTGLAAGSASGNSVRYEQVLLLNGVNTMAGNLLFTDATYDIGASGATRPRDFYLSRNAVIGGTLDVTGVPTIPTAAADTNTTQAASTAYVLAQAASQAELEAGSSTTKFTTAGRQQYHPSAAKGWANCGFGGTANSSYNVTSLTDTAAGQVTVNWATDFSSAANACVVATASNDGGASNLTFVAQCDNTNYGSGSTLIETIRMSDFATTDCSRVLVVAFGDQA